jgi:hypothetical protein
MTSPLRSALTSTPATLLFALGVWLSALGACTWAARQLAPARAPNTVQVPAATACRPPDTSADTTLRAEVGMQHGPAASEALFARVAPGAR